MARSDEGGAFGCACRMCYCCSQREGSETSSATRGEVHLSGVQENGQMVSNGNVNVNGNGNGNRNGNEIENMNGHGHGEALVKDGGSGMPLKSNLKRSSRYSEDNNSGGEGHNTTRGSTLVGIVEEQHPAEGEEQEKPNANGRRKVQWIDAHGHELTQVREFERSDSNQSDEEGVGNADESCTCVIQ